MLQKYPLKNISSTIRRSSSRLHYSTCINIVNQKWGLDADIFAGSGGFSVYLTWVEIASSVSHIKFAAIQPSPNDGGQATCLIQNIDFGYADTHSESNPAIAVGYDDIYVAFQRDIGLGWSCPGSGGQFPENYDVSLSIYRLGGTPFTRKGITIANDGCPQISPKIKTDSQMLQMSDQTYGLDSSPTKPKIYITYINKTNDSTHLNGEVYYLSRNIDTGTPICQPVRITTYDSGAVYSLNLIIDPITQPMSVDNWQAVKFATHGLKINLFWSQINPVTYTYSIFYTRLNPTDGAYPLDYDITPKAQAITTGLIYTPNNLVVTADSANRFFIAFYFVSGTNQDLGVIRVTFWGSTYESLRYLGVQSGSSIVRTNPSLSTDSYGQVFINWEQNSGSAREIWYTNTIIGKIHYLWRN